MSEVSAVLFAKDHAKVARFYSEALGFARISGDAEHSVLNCQGFDLIVHQIPGQFLEPGNDNDAPGRRDNGPIRLDFPVRSIEDSRTIAARLGGRLDASPPPWAPADANFRLGHDPEGNVFRVIERVD